jgi:hypothetical protein
MRITDVSLYSGTPEGATENITFGLRTVNSTDQYMVRQIVGLDSEELTPRFYGFGLQTKPKFYDFKMKARTIVIRVVLNPRFNLGETYSDVRDTIYRAISAVRTGIVALHFNSSGATVARIYGFITKVEVGYFNQLPEVQVTLRCDDPVFRAINSILYTSADLKTTNPIILADSLSTAPHGFQMELTFKANTPTFTVQDLAINPEWRFVVVPDGGFLTGDVLYFSSETKGF